MKIIRILPILLISLVLLTGAVAAVDTTSIEIQVVDSADNQTPIEGAAIVVTGNGITTPITGVTNSSGSWSYDGLSSSIEYTATIKKTEYFDNTVTLRGGEIKVVKLESVLEPITFFVRDVSNNPLEEITITLVNEEGKTSGVTDASGKLNIGMKRDTNYTVTAGSEYYTYKTETLNLPSSETSYKFVLTRAIVSPVVTVYNEQKNVIKGANVFLNGNAVGTTDEYGKCHLPSVETGTYPLSVQADGYSLYSKNVTLTQDTNDITVDMSSASASVSITVKDASGNALANALVYTNGDYAGKTDSKGLFTISGDVGKSITITVSRDGYTTAERTYTVVNGTNTADFVLEHGTSFINISVVDGDGKAISEAEIYVDGAAVGKTDAAGNFKFTTVTGKTHLISAYHDGYSGEGVTTTVQAGENNLTLTLKQNINYTWIIIAGVAGLLVILVVILIITGKRRGKSGGNNGSNKYTQTPQRRDSL